MEILNVEILKDILLDTLLDGVRMLPFLFAAFLLLETLEHRSASYLNQALRKWKKAGPLAGALFGCIPQCGFSVMAANLYAGGVLTPGALLAVFLSTSDEAILILLGHPGSGAAILRLIGTKILLAVIAGYAVDFCLSRRPEPEKQISDLCTDCGCHDHHGILRPALNHTVRIFLYLLIFSGALNFAITIFGLDTLSTFLLGGSIFQPFLAALLGFIPNCAASVLLTELYLGGALSFPSVVAGLSTNAGLGLIVLFRVNKNRKDDLRITALLYASAVAAGVILHLTGF